MFWDRRDAGRQLASRLRHLTNADLVVIGLPRGGVVVADEVARALGAELDVTVVRKLGAPSQPELALGAIAEGGVTVVHEDLVDRLGVDPETLERVIADERRALDDRITQLRGGRPMIALDGRTVVVVDDGLATGATAEAAVRSVRARGARHVVLGVPVASASGVRALEASVDELVVVEVPLDFYAVGQWYQDFAPVEDSEVVEILAVP